MNPTQPSQPLLRYSTAAGSTKLTVDTILNLPNPIYWNTVALMCFTEIRSVVDESVPDSEILKALSKRFMDCTFWHHLPEANIRTILNTILNWNGPTEIEPKKVMESCAEDIDYINQCRQDFGLEPVTEVDNSLLYQVLAEYTESK